MSPDALCEELSAGLGGILERGSEGIPTDISLMEIGADSLAATQFAGMISQDYALDIPDEFLFREGATIEALAGAILHGGLPDDWEAGADAVGPKREADFVVDNCACCLVCPCCKHKLKSLK